jgi:hypothetical protein
MITYLGGFKRLSAAVILSVLLLGLSGALLARSAVPHLGYGFNVAEWDIARLQAMGFNWIKLFDAPTTPLPLNVLLRVDATAQISVSDLLADLDLKLAYKGNIAAWEIGNEVNIRGNADYGWNGSPDVAAYKTLLCAAYTQIKSQSPNAIVVSAGLAPTGRLTNADQIDDREFLQQLLDMGGGSCLDVVGYHPYGYSADYDAAPDVVSADPTQNCDQGFCFRGAEKIYEIMQAHGAGDKKLWATEFGWITQPPTDCLNDPSWLGRDWQIVSNEKQASNLAGAFQYADEHWPWMGAMFVFNLNYYTAPWYTNTCDQILWYSVRSGSPAESALTAMSKHIARISAHLKMDTPSVSWLIAASSQPITLTAPVFISNDGWQPLVYTATIEAGTAVTPTLLNATGSLSATAQTAVQLSIESDYSLGVYTSTLKVTAAPTGQVKSVPMELRIVDQVYQVFLPLTLH